MSEEFIVGLVLFFLAPTYDHFVKSYKWIAKVMYCVAITLFLSLIPDENYANLRIAVNYKYLFMAFYLTLLLLFVAVLEKTQKNKTDIYLHSKEPEQNIIEQKPAPLPIKQEKPIDYEKFHTYNGVTFKYDSRDGSLYRGLFCHKDKIKLEKHHTGYRSATYHCHICNYSIRMSDDVYIRAQNAFEEMTKAYIKGHLKNLPIESEKGTT